MAPSETAEPASFEQQPPLARSKHARREGLIWERLTSAAEGEVLQRRQAVLATVLPQESPKETGGNFRPFPPLCEPTRRRAAVFFS